MKFKHLYGLVLGWSCKIAMFVNQNGRIDLVLMNPVKSSRFTAYLKLSEVNICCSSVIARCIEKALKEAVNSSNKKKIVLMPQKLHSFISISSKQPWIPSSSFRLLCM